MGRLNRRELLRRTTVAALAGVSPALLARRAGASEIALSPAEVAMRSSLLDKAPAWTATAEIEITQPRGTPRQRTGQVKNQLREDGYDTLRLYRFTAPADLEGTSLLIHENRADEDDVWLYLPAAGKTRRIVSSAKKDSFIGTEFAYVDLMTQRVERFEHAFDGRETVDDRDCVVVVSTPSAPGWAQDIGYSRQVAWTDLESWAVRRVDYFDLQGDRAKTQHLSAFHDAGGGKLIATRREMVNHKSGRATTMVFAGLEVEARIPAREFAPQRLGRR